MTDPLGLIQSGQVTPIRPTAPQAPQGPGEPGAPSFREVFEQSISKVHQLQQDASQAVEDLAAGRRDDVSNVLMAQKKAEVAFQMLMQMRNKMIDAYEEVKQMRV